MADNQEISCRKCGSTILKRYGDGKTKLRTNIIVWDGSGKCTCKCHKCGEETKIPLVFEQKKRRKQAHIVLT